MNGQTTDFIELLEQQDKCGLSKGITGTPLVTRDLPTWKPASIAVQAAGERNIQRIAIREWQARRFLAA